jgi:hypothetical protein
MTAVQVNSLVTDAREDRGFGTDRRASFEVGVPVALRHDHLAVLDDGDAGTRDPETFEVVSH